MSTGRLLTERLTTADGKSVTFTRDTTDGDAGLSSTLAP